LGIEEINSQDKLPIPLDTISKIMTTRKKQTIRVVPTNDPHSMIEESLNRLCCMIFSKSVNKVFSY
jgi:hypothetical protein